MIALAKPPNETFFAHPHALVESREIGVRTRVWAFAHVMAGAKIGSDCNIGEHSFIESGAVIGNGVVVKNGVSLWSGITIEDNVFLGPNCVLTNDPNPRANVRKSPGLTVIRANASIGANATILCGLTIGRFAFVGAGAVVLRSVPDFGLMVGNPARQIGWMCACANKLLLPVLPSAGDQGICRHCERQFVVEIREEAITVKEA